MKYRKKPVVIEAVQWTGGNYDEVCRFVAGVLDPYEFGKFTMPTLEGRRLVSLKDYIIRGVKGEFYPCKPNIFAATYEPVLDDRTATPSAPATHTTNCWTARERDTMKIYIASSWKNQHAVELLTLELRRRGHDVLSFVENNHGEQAGHLAVENGAPMNFDDWVISERGKKSFEYDIQGATTADLVIYIGPSGCDAWAEVGAAWAKGIPILGLHAKGEQVGLMRRMVVWCKNITELRTAFLDQAALQKQINKQPAGSEKEGEK